MNSLTVAGAIIISLSLLLYGIGFITIHQYKSVSLGVLTFLTLGILLNITAHVLMIIGSKGSLITAHSMLGFSSFLVMLIYVVFTWQKFFIKKAGAVLHKKFLTLSKLAYGLWVIAYIAGSLLAILK